MRILLAEDDPLNRAFLTDWLAARGVAVDPVESLSALALQAGKGHDWWLLDRWLAGEDSLDWLAQHPRCRPATGVILISGESSLMLPAAVAHLPKPVPLDELARCLRIAHPEPSLGPLPVCDGVLDLDDAQALRALHGAATALAPLRAMLRKELLAASWLDRVPATPDPSRLDAVHRLRGACALVGCPRLGTLLERLEGCWRRGASADQGLIGELAQARSRLLFLLPRQG
jgi:CheY-like chemotaxis protein